MPLASSQIIFKLDLDRYLQVAKAAREISSHLHYGLPLTQKITSWSSFDVELMTPKIHPHLCSRSCLYLWRGIGLETGCGIARLLLVDLTSEPGTLASWMGRQGSKAGSTSDTKPHHRFSVRTKSWWR